MPGDERLFPIVNVPARPPVLPGLEPMTEELRSGEAVRSASHASSRALFGMSRAGLVALVADLGQPAYRARQLEEAFYRHWASDLSEVSTLPKAVRESLAEAGYEVGLPEIVETFRSVDGTERYLIAGLDGQTVETVWMPGGDGGEVADLDALVEEALEAASLGAVPAEEMSGALDSQGAAADRRREAGSRASRPAQRRATICVSSQIGCAVNCQFCLTA